MARGFGARENNYYNPYGPAKWAKGESPEEIKAAKEKADAKELKAMMKKSPEELEKLRSEYSKYMYKTPDYLSPRGKYDPKDVEGGRKYALITKALETKKAEAEEKINAKGVRSSFAEVRKAVGSGNGDLLKQTLPPKFHGLGLSKPAGTHVAVDYEDLDRNYGGDEDDFIRMIDRSNLRKWEEDGATATEGDGESRVSAPGKEPGSKWVFKTDTWETEDKISYDPKEWGVKQVKTLMYVDASGKSQEVWRRTVYTTQGG